MILHNIFQPGRFGEVGCPKPIRANFANLSFACKPGYPGPGVNSERQPALFFGKLHVADIGAKAQTRAHPHRDQHDIASPQIADIEAPNEIGLSLARAETFVDILSVVEIVNEDEGLAGIEAEIEADRRSSLVNRAVAFHLVV